MWDWCRTHPPFGVPWRSCTADMTSGGLQARTSVSSVSAPGECRVVTDLPGAERAAGGGTAGLGLTLCSPGPCGAAPVPQVKVPPVLRREGGCFGSAYLRQGGELAALAGNPLPYWSLQTHTEQSSQMCVCPPLPSAWTI